MIKVSSSFILEEFANIINDTINHFEKEGQIKSPEYKEVLKFESTALIFWLFQKTDMFPELWHKLILDEMHDQYYSRLKNHGYDSKMRQAVCDDFNLRYKTYNDVFREDQDFSRAGAKFVSFLTERSKVEWDTKDMLIPLYLVEKVTPKFEEFREVMKEKAPLKNNVSQKDIASELHNVSQKDIASGLYMAIIRDRIHEPLRDTDGNIIFTTTEQKKLLLSHLYDLLDRRKLNSAKTQLLAFYAIDNHKIEDDGDLYIQMNFIIDDIKKIQDFFGNIPAETHEFYRKDFLFGKKLNPIQKTLAMSWYVENHKAMDPIVKQALKKVKIIEE